MDTLENIVESYENTVIHRKAKFGHALCGEEITNENSTLNDFQVTCSECRRILRELSESLMKTKIIRKYSHEDELEQEKNDDHTTENTD